MHWDGGMHAPIKVERRARIALANRGEMMVNNVNIMKTLNLEVEHTMIYVYYSDYFARMVQFPCLMKTC